MGGVSVSDTGNRIGRENSNFDSYYVYSFRINDSRVGMNPILPALTENNLYIQIFTAKNGYPFNGT